VHVAFRGLADVVAEAIPTCLILHQVDDVAMITPTLSVLLGLKTLVYRFAVSVLCGVSQSLSKPGWFVGGIQRSNASNEERPGK
jgi:hypothetical protein